MEAFNASGPQPRLLFPVTDAAVRILLLDGDDRRRGRRAEALLDRGVLVDQAAGSLSATTLWKAGAYDLVLVDLRGADAGCTKFISSVQGECSRQKFGFYVAHRPYLTASAEQCRLSLTNDAVIEDHSEAPGFQRGDRILVATKRIAAARQLARMQAQAQLSPRVPQVPAVSSHGIATSDAVTLARQILGGGAKPQPS